MCLTTTTSHCLNTPTMLPEDSHSHSHCPIKMRPLNPSPRSCLDLLLDVSSPSKTNGTTLLRKTGSDTTEEEEDEDDLLDLSDVLMNSISLDDSTAFMDHDDDNEEEIRAAPYDSLYNYKRQKYEWNESFSLLIKMRTTRLSTIVEKDQCPLFDSNNDNELRT